MIRWARKFAAARATDKSGINYPGIDARTAIYAIGDIHGRSDLLDGVHRMIDRDRKTSSAERWLEIYLGDYIDRGPDSAGVISRLRRRSSQRPVRMLMGNHEAMMLDCLDGSLAAQAWLDNGGVATAYSYGVDPRQTDDLGLALAAAVPATDVDFLRGLRLSYQYGPYYFVHAGVKPDRPLDRQSRDDLLWIRDDFLNFKGLFGRIVIHGHTPNPQPEFRPNRINLDTGAFATNRLSCLRIDSSGVVLLSQ